MILVEKQMQSELKQAMLTLPFKERWSDAYIILCWAKKQREKHAGTNTKQQLNEVAPLWGKKQTEELQSTDIKPRRARASKVTQRLRVLGLYTTALCAVLQMSTLCIFLYRLVFHLGGHCRVQHCNLSDKLYCVCKWECERASLLSVRRCTSSQSLTWNTIPTLLSYQ